MIRRVIQLFKNKNELVNRLLKLDEQTMFLERTLTMKIKELERTLRMKIEELDPNKLYLVPQLNVEDLELITHQIRKTSAEIDWTLPVILLTSHTLNELDKTQRRKLYNKLNKEFKK